MNLLFGFSGRIGRLQWWLAQLAIVGVLLAGAVMLFASVGPSNINIDQTTLSPSAIIVNLLMTLPPSGVVVVLLTLVLAGWINIVCTVKRFHDRDKSGFWFLIMFAPYIGGIWQIVECGFLSGSRGINRFGPGPGGLDEFEEEVRATYAEASTRHAPSMQPAVAAPQRASAAARVPMRRSVPAAGFGRRAAG